MPYLASLLTVCPTRCISFLQGYRDLAGAIKKHKSTDETKTIYYENNLFLSILAFTYRNMCDMCALFFQVYSLRQFIAHIHNFIADMCTVHVCSIKS